MNDPDYWRQWRNRRNYPVDVIGGPARLRLDDLPKESQKYLAAYFILADAVPPTKPELQRSRALLERVSPALTELSKATGKYPRYQHVARRVNSGLPRHRKPRLRRSSFGLVT